MKRQVPCGHLMTRMQVRKTGFVLTEETAGASSETREAGSYTA